MPHEIPVSMIAELDPWNNGDGIDLDSWTECEGNCKLTVGYAAMLWPKFELVGNYILHEGCSAEHIAGFENQPNSTPQSVEWVLNHLHLAHFHIHDEANLSPDKLLFLGNIIKEMWQAKLQYQFPDHPCTVEFYIPDDHDDLWEYQVSFWQNKWTNAESAAT